MDQLRTGNLVIRAREQKLQLKIIGSEQGSTELQLEDVTAVLEFLKSYKENSADRRVGFRLDLRQIPTEQLKSLRVAANTPDGISVELRPIDLSVTGLSAESVAFIGKRGARTNVTIIFGEHTVDLPARIIRGSDSSHHIALQFCGVLDERGQPKTPRGLACIFNALESLWLNQRLNLDWGSQ